MLIGDFLFDRLKGLHLIEKKRNKVRYKYGQKLIFTYKPSLYFSNNQNQSEEMIVCNTCGTYVHQDLVFRNYGKNFCSKNCSRP